MRLSKFFTPLFITLLAFSGCNKKTENKNISPEIQVNLPQKSSDHQWFYFNNGSFTETDLPQHSPILSLKPWTESVRICDGNVNSEGKGYLLVNHFGVMIFDHSDSPSLVQDMQMFSDSTAGNLVFENSEPFFTLSKNSFFNKSAVPNLKDKPHIVRLSEENKMFLPVVTHGDLKLEDSAEVSGTFYDGNRWISSIKTSAAGKTTFEYIEWKSVGALGSLPPFSQQGKISIRRIDEASYRKNNSPESFSKAPARLKELLSDLPSDFDFLLSCHDVDGVSPRYFARTNTDDGALASAIINDSWICVVFGDGTTYFCGGLEGEPLINNGKTVAFRLPKLPEGYSYGDFCISGNYMIISWEENDFYKTGRSGFLTVNLKEIFG